MPMVVKQGWHQEVITRMKAIVGPGPSPVLSLIKAWRRSFEAAQAFEQ